MFILKMNFLFIISLISSDRNRDFYKILNVTHDATDSQIKKRYMILSNKYHPDKNKNPGAEEIYTDVIDAYQTLFDVNKRRIYDLYGEPGVHLYEAPQTDTDPLIALTKGQAADANQEKVRKRGKPIHMPVPVELEDFYLGKPIELNMTRNVMCRCPEAGFYCDKCRGKTTIREAKIVKSYLEKGFPEGKEIILKNFGDSNENIGPADLILTLISKPHKLYKRKGDDLYVSIDVSLKEVLCGFKRTIQGIDGQPLVIETAESFSEPLIIKGRGLPKYMNPGVFGDVIVIPNIKYPNDLSKEQISAISKLIQ